MGGGRYTRVYVILWKKIDAAGGVKVHKRLYYSCAMVKYKADGGIKVHKDTLSLVTCSWGVANTQEFMYSSGKKPKAGGGKKRNKGML